MYRNFNEWVEEAAVRKLTLAQVVLDKEMRLTGKTDREILGEMYDHWLVMRDFALKVLEEKPEIPEELAHNQVLKQRLLNETRFSMGNFPMELVRRMIIMATAGSGMNSVLTAVLLAVTANTGASDLQLLAALLVADGVGDLMDAVVAPDAAFACAAAPAAAAVVTLADGTAEMVGNAISIACLNGKDFGNGKDFAIDPMTEAQPPDSFYTASQAVNAVISADMAMSGQRPAITPDEAIEALNGILIVPGDYAIPPDLKNLNEEDRWNIKTDLYDTGPHKKPH